MDQFLSTIPITELERGKGLLQYETRDTCEGNRNPFTNSFDLFMGYNSSTCLYRINGLIVLTNAVDWSILLAEVEHAIVSPAIVS